MSRLGIYFGPEKQEALLRGDTSNAVVNRYFVYSFQTIGLSFPVARDESPATVRLLAGYIQRAWETFIDIYETDNQKLKAQGLLLLIHSLVNGEFHAGARFYLLKVCELINNGDLRYMPVYGRPPELSDQVREDAAVLSQTIFLENYFYLALDGQPPVKTAKIEREFRWDFQVRIIRLGLEVDLVTWSSKPIQLCSTCVR